MKKRMIGFALALSMVFSLSAPALAVEIDNEILAQRMEEEIEQKKQELFSDAYAQLEAQDALSLYDDFVTVMSPQIETAVMAKYGALHSRAMGPYSARNGAVVSYVANGSLVQYLYTYMNTTDTQKLLDNNSSTLDVINLVTDICDKTIDTIDIFMDTHHAGIVFDVFSTMIIAMNTIPRDKIEACGHAYTCSMYDPVENIKATLVFAWTDYEYIYVDTGALGIRDFNITYKK